MDENYSEKLCSSLTNTLDYLELQYNLNEESGVISFNLNPTGIFSSISFAITVRASDYIVYAIFPFRANSDDPEVMARTAEFICRANFGVCMGNFEMDYNDGEIRYKCFVDCSGVAPAQSLFANSLICARSMLEGYGTGMLNVIFNGADAESAVCSCKENMRERSDAGDTAQDDEASEENSIDDCSDESVSDVAESNVM